MSNSSFSDLNLNSLTQSSLSTESGRRPIGIFDSGVGGLTVLKELYCQLPQESIIYFGDTARLPYGNRSPEEIIQFVREIITWMVAQDVKMVLMACNTSSAIALEIVRKEFDVPILGLILPGAHAALQGGKRIGVIATYATVTSNAYRQAILEIDPTAQVWQVPCPEFVPLIEQNRLHDPYTKEIAQQYLEPLIRQKIDTLIYGCTHYPHLEPVVGSILNPNVQLINPAQSLVTATNQELELLGIKNLWSALPTRFSVSGSPTKFAQLSKQWLGCTPKVEKVHLQEVCRNKIPLKSVD